jgi:peptide/nickel transport system substrate-binding protein
MKITSRFLLITAAFALLFSCGGSDKKTTISNSNPNNWKTENTVIYHIIGDIDDMHPTNGRTSERQEIHLYTQVYLIQTNYAQLGTACPQLAKATPTVSEDGLNYFYELRTDLKWDDGSPITAEDLVFTFKANKCPLVSNPHAKPYVGEMKNIIVDPTDKNKVTLVMKKKYIQNLWIVTDFPLMQRSYFDPQNVLAKYTFEQFDDPKFVADKQDDLKEWAKNFNDPKYSHDLNFLPGAGPYKISAWDPGQSLTLTKKKNHWTAGKTGLFEQAFPDKIIFKISKEPNATKIDFKKQVFDASTYLDPKTLLELQDDAEFNKNYSSAFVPTYNFSYVGMNMRPDNRHKKLFTDKNVRRAIAHLVPVQDINKVVYKGKNRPIVGPVNPTKVEYNKDLTLIAYDVEKAKKMLEAAGWKDTDGDNIIDKMIEGEKVQFEFKLNYLATSKTWEDMAKLISESFLKAGIKANLTPVQYEVHNQKNANHDFDMFLGSWAGGSTPDDFTQIWNSGEWASKGSNYVGFGNAQTDALIDSIKYELDDAKRNPMVKRFQAIVYDEQPYVFLFAAMRRVAIHNRFDNRDMYSERPGILLNRLKLNNVIAKPTAEN